MKKAARQATKPFPTRKAINFLSEIENDINQIVKAINHTYRINKLNTIWRHKEASNKKVLANQLGGVSKVISSLAEDIKTEEKVKEIEKNGFKDINVKKVISIGTCAIKEIINHE